MKKNEFECDMKTTVCGRELSHAFLNSRETAASLVPLLPGQEKKNLENRNQSLFLIFSRMKQHNLSDYSTGIQNVSKDKSFKNDAWLQHLIGYRF